MRFRKENKHKLNIYIDYIAKKITTPFIVYHRKHLKSSIPLYGRAGRNKNQNFALYFQATYQRHPVYQ